MIVDNGALRVRESLKHVNYKVNNMIFVYSTTSISVLILIIVKDKKIICNTCT